MVCPVEAGLSEESKEIRALMDRMRFESRWPISFSWREFLQEEIKSILAMYSKAHWDGYDAGPVSTTSAIGAAMVLNALPDHILRPSMVPEPDGEIALEWRTDRGTDFSLSVSGTTLSYAGVFGGSSRKYGVEQFFGVLPPAILRILADYFSQA
jgi:hypothetical protein